MQLQIQPTKGVGTCLNNIFPKKATVQASNVKNYNLPKRDPVFPISQYQPVLLNYEIYFS